MRLKSELYEKEQAYIMNKIINILELDNENSITLYELDNNKKKQEQIMKLIPNIRKYFSFNNVIGLTNPTKCKRPYFSIIKFITKNNYNLYNSDSRINTNDKIIRTTKYIFVKKNT